MTIADYEKLLEGKKCRWHQEPIALPTKLKSYDHDGGYVVEGLKNNGCISLARVGVMIGRSGSWA